jgi:hypothetical protein
VARYLKRSENVGSKRKGEIEIDVLKKEKNVLETDNDG